MLSVEDLFVSLLYDSVVELYAWLWRNSLLVAESGVDEFDERAG